MVKEAASGGLYETGGQRFPRIQILTVAQMIDDKKPETPFGFTERFKKAAVDKRDDQISIF